MRLLLALLILALPLSAQGAPKPSGKFTGTSHVEFRVVKGVRHTVIHNERFSQPFGAPDMILHEVLEMDQGDGQEWDVASVTAEAFSPDKPDSVAWKVHGDGEEGTYLGEFYATTKYGSGGGWNTVTYFSLPDGGRVYTSSQDEGRAFIPVEIEVPNAGTHRYVTVHEGKTDKSPWVLEYGDAHNVMSRILIRVPQFTGPPAIALRGKKSPDPNNRNLRHFRLWDTEKIALPASVSGISIVLNFQPELVVIPVENDAPDLTRATVAKGFRLSLPLPSKP